MDTNEIDISKLDTAEVLAALYNASRQGGMGLMHSRGQSPMTKEQAQAEISERMEASQTLYFDYLHGRVMKVHVGKPILLTDLYDRDNGEGAAARALEPLFEALALA